jgi:hypothetical protein
LNISRKKKSGKKHQPKNIWQNQKSGAVLAKGVKTQVFTPLAIGSFFVVLEQQAVSL